MARLVKLIPTWVWIVIDVLGPILASGAVGFAVLFVASCSICIKFGGCGG